MLFTIRPHETEIECDRSPLDCGGALPTENSRHTLFRQCPGCPQPGARAAQEYAGSTRRADCLSHGYDQFLDGAVHGRRWTSQSSVRLIMHDQPLNCTGDCADHLLLHQPHLRSLLSTVFPTATTSSCTVPSTGLGGNSVLCLKQHPQARSLHLWFSQNLIAIRPGGCYRLYRIEGLRSREHQETITIHHQCGVGLRRWAQFQAIFTQISHERCSRL